MDRHPAARQVPIRALIRLRPSLHLTPHLLTAVAVAILIRMVEAVTRTPTAQEATPINFPRDFWQCEPLSSESTGRQ